MPRRLFRLILCMLEVAIVLFLSSPLAAATIRWEFLIA
jgi:hypothetical protein